MKFGSLVWAVGGGYPIFAHLFFNFRHFCREKNHFHILTFLVRIFASFSRLIQEEKETTEIRAEELEHKVAYGSIAGSYMDLATDRPQGYPG